ncbi:MAG: efflux transporter outer membrane subunit [Acidobacteriaceae bacterium]|nr:efflux transporter outer membrane subunit [Acidobacteriaceae bacterium]
MNLQKSLPALGLFAPLLCAGCRVGPNYIRPVAPTPPSFSENGRNGNWADAAPADDKDRGAWWTLYHDAELTQLEERCVASNQTLNAALHAYDQAHQLVLANKSSLYPTVSLGGSANRNRISNTRPLRPANASQYYWDFLIPLNVSWEPDFWGRIRRQIESSSANAQASAADLANVRLSLQGTLALTYFQIRGIDLQAQLLQKTIDAYTSMLKLTQDRLKRGLSNESDVQQATAQLEAARAELVGLGVQRAQNEHAIAVLVGVPATGFRIADKALVGDPPAIPTGIPSELLERRPDIASTERRVASANALIGVAKGAYYPRIVLGAGGGVESSIIGDVFNAGSATWYAGPSASEVLFDAGKRRAQVEFAVAQRDQAAALYREQVLSAFRDVEDQLSALRVLAEQAEVQQRAVAAAQRSTQLSISRYKGGLAAYLEVLTNQTIQLNDERIAASLVTGRILASAQLQVALGGGWNASQLPQN